MIAIEPFSDLVFVYQEGCGACEEAAPELDAFAAKNPTLMIMKIRADGPNVTPLLGTTKIRATPTYVYRRGGRGIMKEGAMTAKELAKWIEAIETREQGDHA
jgi:thiol-disulfide isomerase/thioredoxin